MPSKRHAIGASLVVALCLGLSTAGHAENSTASPTAAAVAAATTPEQAVRTLQQQWAVANYQRQGKERVKALEALAEQAREAANAFQTAPTCSPGRPSAWPPTRDPCRA